MHFTNITVEWSPKTFIFYLAIIIGCYLIAYAFRKNTIVWGKGKKERYPTGLLMVAMILLFVKCFNTTGRDLRTGYYFNFQSATSMLAYRDQTVEPGFRLLMVIVRKITDNYAAFLFVVGLITILPVIHLINKYRDKIDVPTAVLLFTSIYFVNSFSAYRQYMAVSLSLFMLDAIIQKKPYRALIWLAISSTFHISCIILVIPYVLCFAKIFSKKMIAISAIVFFATVLLAKDSIAMLLGGSDRYNIYLVSQKVTIGMEQIVYYIPFFCIMFSCRKYASDKHMSKIGYVYVVTGFAFGMLSYVIPIFGRMASIFLPIVILIPFFIKLYRVHHKKPRNFILRSITLVYCLARFYIWITQYYSIEDLMPYSNIFGRII